MLPPLECLAIVGVKYRFDINIAAEGVKGFIHCKIDAPKLVWQASVCGDACVVVVMLTPVAEFGPLSENR